MAATLREQGLVVGSDGLVRKLQPSEARPKTSRRTIGYGKFGRSMNFRVEKFSTSGGDADAVMALDRLSRTHPEVDWLVVGCNTGGHVGGLNVQNPWDSFGPCQDVRADESRNRDMTESFWDIMGPEVLKLDELLLWAGQHGNSNAWGLPSIADRDFNTSPFVQCIRYGGYLSRSVNELRSLRGPDEWEETWLRADFRNFLKARDLRWPSRRPVLSHWTEVARRPHERFEDRRDPGEFACGRETQARWWRQSNGRNGIWESFQEYKYAGIDLISLPDDVPEDPDYDLERPVMWGVVANESRGKRPELLREYVLDRWGDQARVWGSWTPSGCAVLGREPKPLPWYAMTSTLRSVRYTVLLPVDGNGWPTAKAWECFRAGVIPFMLPGYDTRGTVVPNETQQEASELGHQLRTWLRVESPEQLALRVQALEGSPDLREHVARCGYLRLHEQWLKWRGGIRAIEERLGLDTGLPLHEVPTRKVGKRARPASAGA